MRCAGDCTLIFLMDPTWSVERRKKKFERIRKKCSICKANYVHFMELCFHSFPIWWTNGRQHRRHYFDARLRLAYLHVKFDGIFFVILVCVRCSRKYVISLSFSMFLKTLCVASSIFYSMKKQSYNGMKKTNKFPANWLKICGLTFFR